MLDCFTDKDARSYKTLVTESHCEHCVMNAIDKLDF